MKSTVYLSSLNAAGTALSTARALTGLGREVWIAVPKKLKPQIDAMALGYPIVDTGPETPVLDRLHNELAFHLSSLTPGANADNAVLLMNGVAASADVRSVLRKALRRTWKLHLARVPNREVNAFLRSSIGRLAPDVFPSRHIVAVSFAARPYLLNVPGLVVDTVLDSWDHPVRKCAGYVTRGVVGWNRELGWEWRDYQGAEQIEVGYPVRLGYALRSQVSANAGTERVLMYPIATTSHIRSWFLDEMAFLEKLADRAESHGWQVLVKPMPSSTLEEIPDAVRSHPAIRLGRFESSSGPLDYVLDDEVNARRLAALQQASVVINTVTTFGLDAAAAGVPVIQVDMRRCKSFPALASAARNRHLERYLYRGQGCVEPGDALERLDGLLADRNAMLERARDTSTLLKGWLTGDGDGSGEAALMTKALHRIMEGTA